MANEKRLIDEYTLMDLAQSLKNRNMANEKRLIDANALVDGIEKRYCEPCKAEGKDYHEVACRACWVDDMRIEIEDAPTVDAVEVVRCKECKHYDNSEGICWCHLNSKFFPGGFDWHGFPEDGFCSYGERRTDDGKAD